MLSLLPGPPLPSPPLLHHDPELPLYAGCGQGREAAARAAASVLFFAIPLIQQGAPWSAPWSVRLSTKLLRDVALGPHSPRWPYLHVRRRGREGGVRCGVPAPAADWTFVHTLTPPIQPLLLIGPSHPHLPHPAGAWTTHTLPHDPPSPGSARGGSGPYCCSHHHTSVPSGAATLSSAPYPPASPPPQVLPEAVPAPLETFSWEEMSGIKYAPGQV